MADADRALLIAERSEQSSRESVVIAHESKEIARIALLWSRWSVIATILAVLLAWFLGKYI